LSRASVEAPLDPRWKILGPEEAARLHRRRQAEHARWNLLGPRNRRRFLRYFLGTAVGFAGLAWLVIGADARTLLLGAGAGALVGTAMAVLRPSEYLAGGLYGLAGLGTAFAAGRHPLLALLAAMMIGCVGLALGRLEELKRFDQES
jgi:hypothetical protein